MWVACSCGRRHWGTHGAAGLVVRDGDRRVLMTHRSELVHYGGTWSFPGGAIERRETAVQAALREMDEEIGLPPEAVSVVSTVVGLSHSVWSYTYVIADLLPQWSRPRLDLNWETAAVAWVLPDDMAALELHPDLRSDLPALHAALGHSVPRSPQP